MLPQRIQRKRTKGWRLPAGARSITRPGVWGNPYAVAEFGLDGALARFRAYARARLQREPTWLDPLRGQHLACWCAVGAPCHGDILLEMLAPTVPGS